MISNRVWTLPQWVHLLIYTFFGWLLIGVVDDRDVTILVKAEWRRSGLPLRGRVGSLRPSSWSRPRRIEFM